MKALSMGPTFKIQEPECPPHTKKKKKREGEEKKRGALKE